MQPASTPMIASVKGVSNTWFRIWGLGFRVEALEFKVLSFGCRVLGFGFKSEGPGSGGVANTCEKGYSEKEKLGRAMLLSRDKKGF